jgi:REP element-mobilizing transposase RayT
MTVHEKALPRAYFLTFSAYGARLHGDDRGTVDRAHNQFGTPRLGPDEERRNREAREVGVPVSFMNEEIRVLDRTVRDVCSHREWPLLALNIRRQHVHAVLTTTDSPEKATADLKAWCTRKLVEAGFQNRGARLWARHGSTRYLWTLSDVEGAVFYVLNLQGPPLG